MREASIQASPHAPDREPLPSGGMSPLELKRRSIRGAAWVFSSQWYLFLANLLAMIILARLLEPAHFGLVAMAATLMTFLQVLKDAGFSTTVVQRPELTHPQLSAIFWLNLALGTVLTAGFAASGPLIAWLYDEPAVGRIAWALSGTFVLDSLASHHGALLQRRLQFAWVNVAGVVAQTIGLTLAVIMALRGWGVWSLVALQMIPKAVVIPFVWYAAQWFPGTPASWRELHPLLRFAGGVAGFNIVNYFARNLDNVLIGVRLGPDALGIYGRAYTLFMLPFQQLTYPLGQVVLPALARLRHDPERFASYYVKSIYFLAAAALPLTAALIAVPERIVGVVLGPQWLEAARLLRLLACILPIQVLMSSAGWVCVATGRSKAFFWLGFLNAGFCVAGFAIGLWWGGLMGLVVGYVLATAIVGPIWLRVAYHGTEITGRRLIGKTASLLLLALLCAGSAIGLDAVVRFHSDLLALSLQGTLAAGVYLAGLWLFGHVRQMRSLLKSESFT